LKSRRERVKKRREWDEMGWDEKPRYARKRIGP